MLSWYICIVKIFDTIYEVTNMGHKKQVN